MSIVDRALKTKFIDWNDTQLANCTAKQHGKVTYRMALVEIARREMAREIYPSNRWQIEWELTEQFSQGNAAVTY